MKCMSQNKNFFFIVVLRRQAFLVNDEIIIFCSGLFQKQFDIKLFNALFLFFFFAAHSLQDLSLKDHNLFFQWYSKFLYLG